MSNHLVKIVRTIRELKDIKQDDLGLGMYPKGSLSKIETGEQTVGKWEVDLLLERLGASTTKFGCLYQPSELVECAYRENLLFLLREGKTEELRAAWWEAMQAVGNDDTSEEKDNKKRKHVCQKQFLEYIRLISYYGEDTCIDEIPLTLEDRLQVAMDTLTMTQSRDVIDRMENALLGRIERVLVALYADLLCQTVDRPEEGIRLYRELLEQTEYQIEDREELCFQYPAIAALALRRMYAQGLTNEKDICGKLWNMLRESMKLYGLKTLLQYELNSGLASNMDMPENIDRGQLLDILIGLENQDPQWYGRFSQDWMKDQLSDFLEVAVPDSNGMGLGEMVSRCRKELHLTQDDLTESGAVVRTIDRMERGQVNSSVAVYQSVFRRLGQEEYRYYPFVVTDEYGLHEQRKRVSFLMNQWKYEEADGELRKLEEKLNMDNRINQQCVQSLRIVIDEKLGRITSEERLIKLKEALALTVPEGVNLAKWPLRRTEINLLVKIANTLETQEGPESAEKILREALESWSMGRTRNGHVYEYRNLPQFFLIAYNLERYLGDQGKHEEGLRISSDALKKAMRVGNGGCVVEFLCKIAWNKECLFEQQDGGRERKRTTCLPMYRQALEIAKVIDYEYYVSYIQNHCKKEYNLSEISSHPLEV